MILPSTQLSFPTKLYTILLLWKCARDRILNAEERNSSTRVCYFCSQLMEEVCATFWDLELNFQYRKGVSLTQ